MTPLLLLLLSLKNVNCRLFLPGEKNATATTTALATPEPRATVKRRFWSQQQLQKEALHAFFFFFPPVKPGTLKSIIHLPPSSSFKRKREGEKENNTDYPLALESLNASKGISPLLFSLEEEEGKACLLALGGRGDRAQPLIYFLLPSPLSLSFPLSKCDVWSSRPVPDKEAEADRAKQRRIEASKSPIKGKYSRLLKPLSFMGKEHFFHLPHCVWL